MAQIPASIVVREEKKRKTPDGYHEVMDVPYKLNCPPSIQRPPADRSTNAKVEAFHYNKIRKLHPALEQEKTMKMQKVQHVKDKTLLKQDTIIGDNIPLIALEQVCISGYLLAEELGRFLLYTCKLFSQKLLTEDFVFQALANASSERLGCWVPKSILQARGPQWVYNTCNVLHESRLEWQKELEEERKEKMRRPTTLTAQNVSLVLKINDENSEVLSLPLTNAQLQEINEGCNGSGCEITLSREDHPEFSEHIIFDTVGGVVPGLTLTILAFRVDTNQVASLITREQIYDLGDGDYFALEDREDNRRGLSFHIALDPEDDQDENIDLELRNCFFIDSVDTYLPPNYTFLKALDHDLKWLP